MSWHTKWKNDNNLTDCCKCEPCCGEPCNFVDGLVCCLCFSFCGFATVPKLLAYSQNQDCSCINHCCLGQTPYVGVCLLVTSLRHNLRIKDGTGTDDKSTTKDCVLACCPVVNCMSCCQQLRSVPKEAWKWWDKIGDFKCMTSPCLFPGCVDR